MGERNLGHPTAVEALRSNDVAPPSRVVIEDVWPALPDGHSVKRVVGDTLDVWADIFRDGHDKIAAALSVREPGAPWRVVPMRHVDNDRWNASTALSRVGTTQYIVEAWTDHYESWRAEIGKKLEAGQQVATELGIGRTLFADAAARASGDDRAALDAILSALDGMEDEALKAALLTGERAAAAMQRVPDRSDSAEHGPIEITVDAEPARFSAWYEIFPRSQGTDPTKSGSFVDCIRRLPAIRDMGFNVLYMPPIHPIGRINRKGRNNATTAQPGDPGSPYAIGSTEGGHTALHPELGTMADFRTFVRAAHEHGMELALDFAIQAAPDHPWLREHPQWFRRNPDGTIKYAENPPKKYEDIVNFDFEQPDWRAMWEALRDVVLFWASEGVRIFRVDNPHTKPVPFWRWLIQQVKARHPDAIFLAEAFTRPKMMRQLAKIGFTQSYSYFTWRNTKAELTEYLTELTQTEMREYFRPNFFANTPDILPFYLQTGGRPGFVVRLVLAATLSPSYGIYSGFELCEAAALPEREEYLDSEKYEVKAWDWDRPGNIKPEITRLNALRRQSPALRLFANLAFHEADHDSVLFYRKSDADDHVLVLVNLDPHEAITCEIELPMAALGLAADALLVAIDALSGETVTLRGPRAAITLDPARNPTMVLGVSTPQ